MRLYAVLSWTTKTAELRSSAMIPSFGANVVPVWTSYTILTRANMPGLTRPVGSLTSIVTLTVPVP